MIADNKKSKKGATKLYLTNDATFALSFSAPILRITAVGVNDKGLEEEADCFAVDCCGLPTKAWRCCC